MNYVNEDANTVVSCLKNISFDLHNHKKVTRCEFFSADTVMHEYEKEEYLYLEISFSGKMILYHEETHASSYIF